MQGECLCGAVRFDIAGTYTRVIQCHCSLCRKQGGALANAALFVRREDFRWLAGEEKISQWQRDSGFRSHFCATCGSPVPNPLGTSAYVWVPTGLLPGTAPLSVAVHICLGSKAAWDATAAGGKQFQDMPSFATLVSLLHAEPA